MSENDAVIEQENHQEPEVHPIADQVDQTPEVPVEQPIEEPTEAVIEETVEAVVEEPVVEVVAEPVKEVVEETVEAVVEEPAAQTMEELMDQFDADALSIDFPKAGEIRDGIIASISEGQILVSVGAKSEGLITGKEYEAIPEEILSTLSVGKAIPVFIVTPEDQSGNLILSFSRAVEEQSWIDAEGLLKSGESFDSKVVGYNKGGLLVPLSTIRGFIPASQMGLSRRLGVTGDTPEAKYKEFIGEDVSVCVIEVDRERHRLILSERAASNETRDMIRDKVMDELEEGGIRKGRVTSLADFGAFVNIGGADGLVHLSEISWDRITHPSQALKVGDEVKVKVISVDKDRRRIGLSIRQLQGDPWSVHVKNLTVGQLVEAEIIRLTNFGAFARLNTPGDLEGLIHISELSDKRVEHPKEVLKVGDVVTLRILKIDDESHRIGLSMRRVDSPAYADMDWKSLVADYDLNQGEEGETLATIVGEEQASEAAAAQVAESAESAAETVETVEAVVEEVAEPAAEVVEDVVEPAADVVEEVVETAAEAVEEAAEAAADVVEEAVETVVDEVEEVLEPEAEEKPEA